MQDQTPSTPRFSVVIPTHRRNRLLGLCLDRLAAGAQTLPADAYEVIVADDGPEADNAEAFMRERYPWARWVAGPRRGPAANRNRGAAEARGEWLAFTDDDCLPTPGWLAAFDARLAQAAEGGGDGMPRVLEGLTSAGGARDFGPFLTGPYNHQGGCLWSCNFAIDRRLFEEMGGFDAGFPFPHLEDVDLRTRLEARREAYPFVPAAEVEHPPRPTLSTTQWARYQESAFYLARKQGVPVARYGMHPAVFARGWVHGLRACHRWRDMVSVTLGTIGGLFLIACRWPFWGWKYRRQ